MSGTSNDGAADGGAAAPDEPAEVSLRLYGPGVTPETMAEAGEALAGLVAAVGEEMGVKGVRWELSELAFVCDGCERRQPLDAERTGWRHESGMDYCPDCETAAVVA